MMRRIFRDLGLSWIIPDSFSVAALGMTDGRFLVARMSQETSDCVVGGFTALNVTSIVIQSD